MTISKRHADVQRDNDSIPYLVLGSAPEQRGASASLTRASGSVQEEFIRWTSQDEASLIVCGSTSRVWVIPNEVSTARQGLICFHHMGGQASVYRDWRELPDTAIYAVQLPGRETRREEACIDAFYPAVEAIAAELAGLGLSALYFYGHSMGALFAYEVAHSLRSRHSVEIDWLFAGGLWAPDRHTQELERRRFSVRNAVKYMQIPQTLLSKAHFWQGFMAMFEADARLFQSYEYRKQAPLPCPITVFLGSCDPVASRAEAEGWRAHTKAHFEISEVAGSHMFHRENATALLSEIGSVIEASR